MLKKQMDSRTNKDFKEIKPIIERCSFIKNIKLNRTGKDADTLHLNDSDKIEFCKLLKYKEVPSGDCIYRRGEENDCIYFILKGKVAITYPAKTDNEIQEEMKKHGTMKRQGSKFNREDSSVSGVSRQYSNAGSVRSMRSARSARSMRSMRSRTSRIDRKATK